MASTSIARIILLCGLLHCRQVWLESSAERVCQVQQVCKIPVATCEVVAEISNFEAHGLATAITDITSQGLLRCTAMRELAPTEPHSPKTN